MRKKDIFIIYVFLFICCTLRSYASIRIEGNRCHIDIEKHHLTAEKVSQESEVFVVVGGFSPPVNSNLSYFVANLAVISMEKAESLSARYGDFFRCDSAGSGLAKDAVKEIFLISDNFFVKNSIQKALRLSSIHKHPVIKISASKLKIL